MRKLRLLIVDDDDNICQLVKEVAETCNYHVSIAHDEQAMLNVCNDKQTAIDVILLDLQLGDTDGVELLRYLAENEYQGRIVLFSGTDHRILHTAEQLGKTSGLSMVGSLQKPANISEISKILNSLATAHSSGEVSYDRLREGIENFQMRLHYQPQIDLTTGHVMGMEALVRWEPKAHELIFPDAFIPIAESTDLITPLTFWVIEEAFKQSVIWEEQKHILNISINLSPKVLSGLLLPDKIQQLAEKYRVNNHRITFEITETAVMGQPRIFMDILTRLRLKMFSLSVDDFGTGYSSLLELYRLPFNELKIDKSFIIGIEHDEDSRIIVEGIIQLAHHLGLKTVIEGVETQESYDIVHGYGSDFAQGYFIAKPMPSDKVVPWLKDNEIFIPHRKS